jgi:DNA-binding transcriptional LysR family regulator
VSIEEHDPMAEPCELTQRPASAAAGKQRSDGRSAGNLKLVETAALAVDAASSNGRSAHRFTPAKLEAFVAVAEGGGLSAAARQLHISQSALSQTINGLERQLGVELVSRSSTGACPTEAGRALLHEAREVLARHDQLFRVMAGYRADHRRVIRLGTPFDLAPAVVDAIGRFAAGHPEARVIPAHLPVTQQLAALQRGELDVGLMNELPTVPDLDAVVVQQQHLGVLISAELGAALGVDGGVRLDALARLQWLGFARSDSPTWYDELVAVLHSHGIEVASADGVDGVASPAIALTAVSCGQCFSLVPPVCPPVPETIVWAPLIGHPIVRRTWAAWPAGSRRRDVAQFIAALDTPDCS